MSTSPNQLDEIFRQVKNAFASHPVISVNPTKGDPPDQYEITYTITGMYKKGKGEISESTDHTVELTIPFGFPHFPPSCKPKSDTFHPDFDPAAICLGDFWEQDRPLSDLIIHIGQMINGEIYSTTNAFNEDAAAWYLNHPDKLPLTHIKWGIENDEKSSSQDRIHEIDTLDDTDLTTEFDFLSLEQGGDDEDIILNTSFPEVESSVATDLEGLRLLEKQKKYYSLLKTGESITEPSNALSRLLKEARGEIQKVEKLHREAKKLENKGNAQIALEKYQQITTYVSDFPTIDSDIHRIKQTLALLEDINPDIAPDFFESHVSADSIVPDKDVLEEIDKNTSKFTQKGKTVKRQAPNDLFLSKKRGKNKHFLFMLLGILVIAMGYGGYFWYSVTNTLRNAEDAYAQCSTSHANNQFDVAKRSCDKALQLVSEVKLFHQDFARQLEKFILEILQSEKLTQGLAGNILLDGRYISKNKEKTLLSIKQKLNEAENLYREEKWQPALQLYGTLLSQAENNDFLPPPAIEDIKRKSLLAEFRMSYDPAQVLMQNSQWEDAIEKLLQAQNILVSLPELDREQYSEQLQYALQKSQFANLKEQGDLSFTGSDWLSAIATYNLALVSGQKTALTPESIDAIRNNIKRAELYTTINNGNKAFAAGAWDDAIEAYSKASAFLSSKQSSPSPTDSDINIQKLARIILQASIIRDRQIVQTLLEKNDLVNAKRTYQKIIANIANSSFGPEEEFINTTAEISTSIQSLDEQIALMEKMAYLNDNYQTLFVANYPAAIAENLTNPVINSTKETKSKLVFRMQCTENDGGRPLTLVMFYAYDKKTGRWSLFSEN